MVSVKMETAPSLLKPPSKLPFPKRIPFSTVKAAVYVQSYKNMILKRPAWKANRDGTAGESADRGTDGTHNKCHPVTSPPITRTDISPAFHAAHSIRQPFNATLATLCILILQELRKGGFEWVLKTCHGRFGLTVRRDRRRLATECHRGGWRGWIATRWRITDTF